MDIVSQLARSPAMQQVAGQLAGPDQARTGGPAGGGEPDFGALLQQMLPVVGQVWLTVMYTVQCVMTPSKMCGVLHSPV
jgi:hypothetical protein